MDQNKSGPSDCGMALFGRGSTGNWSPVGGREASSALRRMTEIALQCKGRISLTIN